MERNFGFEKGRKEVISTLHSHFTYFIPFLLLLLSPSLFFFSLFYKASLSRWYCCLDQSWDIFSSRKNILALSKWFHRGGVRTNNNSDTHPHRQENANDQFFIICSMMACDLTSANSASKQTKANIKTCVQPTLLPPKSVDSRLILGRASGDSRLMGSARTCG